MAKTLLFDAVFDASARTVTLHGNKHQRRMLLITNTTDNQIIYNFADPTRTGTFSYDHSSDHTTITLLYDTTSMSDTDTLQVLEEDDSVKMEPSETFVDAVSKFRVSNPENLVDTDFEYGPQASKWETIQTINNIPSFFASTSDTTIPFITKVEAVKGNELITVTTSFDHNLTSGVPITVTGLASVTAEGTYIIQAVPTSTTFTYKARSGQPATRELQGVYTSIIPGKFFQGSQISLDQSIGIVSDLYNYKVTVASITKLTVTTAPAPEWVIGTVIDSDGGGSGTILRIEGSELFVSNVTGSFVDGENITGTGVDIAGGTNTLEIASSGVNAEGNKYLIDLDGDGSGELYPTVPMTRKGIYTFDLSDVSVASHTLRFSTTADGTHGGGSAYTTYVYEHGTPGQAGAYVRIYVNNASPENLYYYCASHANMAGNAGSSISNIDVTAVSYNPITGDMVLTIGSHSLAVGSNVKIKTESIKLTCDYHGDGNTTVKSYPRASGANTSNGADYIYNVATPIISATATTITINANGGQGPVTDTSVHSHTGGTATGAVIAGVGKGIAILAPTTNSKVYLTTVSEHGFADNTNFYFINTVSPKILEVQDPTANAPDGQPYVDTIQQANVNVDTDMTQIDPYDYESTFTLSFDEGQVDYSNNTVEFPAGHSLQNGYSVLYYPPPGARPIGDMRRMQVYWIENVSSTKIAFHHSQRRNYGRVDLSNTYTGTWDGNWSYGKHKIGLCYTCYREYKGWHQWYTRFYTYYWQWGSTYSGHDFNNINNSYGLGNQNWELTAFFSTSRPERGGYGTQHYHYCWPWRHAFGTYWRTYGHHLQSLPRGTSERWQGSYDFITDDGNRGVNTNNYGSYNYGYTIGGRGGHGGSKSYWTSSFYADGWSGGSYMNIRGSSHYWWYYQGYYSNSVNQYFRDISTDGGHTMFWILLKRNTSTNDSFYKQNHGFSHNQSMTLSMPQGGEIHYYYDTYGNRTNTASGTWYVDRIDNNRFRIKSSTGAEPMRLAGVNGQVRFSAVLDNPLKNTIYISTNQFSNNEVVKYTGATGDIGNLTSGNSYYIKTVNGDRFSLTSSVGGSAIAFGSGNTGAGIQEFENTTADFGVVDGSYTTVKAVSETELEVSIPFKVPPSIKQFDGSGTDVNTGSDWININNHYYATGTRVIYDNNGNTTIPGLTNNKDYYVIVIDNAHFKLAESLAEALAGTPVVDITSTSSGFHQLISAALSGEVGGTGTVAVTTGSRRVTGTNAAFQRFFKIGDTIKIVNTTGGTPGVIEARDITAITDDDNLIVSTAWSFTQSGTNYMIPSYIYVRPDGFFLHRPFDGGMEIGTSKSPNSRISRQTRKYFRYQSGKGIQTSLAINFTPQIPISNLTFATSGTQQIQSCSGTINTNILTVANSAVLVANMPVTGTGLALDSFSNTVKIAEIIDATTVQLTADLTETISNESLTFDPVITAECKTTKPHQLSAGLNIKVIDCDTPEFNTGSTATNVLSITDEFTFTYLLTNVPSQSVGAGFPTLAVLAWKDCSVRAGMFDDQNGFFYEMDGQTINCCRRSSVKQLPGTVSVIKGSQIVTGNDTKFTSQLLPKDMVVIRGMSYKVVKVANNTQITIQPSYRGSTNADVIMTKTVDTKVAKANWNIDTGDGLGKSAYILDTSKIQMCYMDYSWYGAGKIRFGFKDQHGHVKYFHEFKHNNILTESYFRSGNLPARYEIENGDNPDYVGTLFHWGTSVIMDGTFQDDEAYLFTASGITHKYTNSSANSAQTNGNSSITEERVNWYYRRYFIRLPFDNGSYGSVLTINTNIYEGSAANGYFQEGRTIDTRSYQSGSTYYVYIKYYEGTSDYFPRNYYSQINSTLGNPAVSSGTTFSVGAPAGNENLIPVDMPLISIRLAPSVDSSITGALGDREIINRMQLKLDSIGILTTHETEVSLRLNPSLSTDTFENVENPSLCQLVRHSSSDTLASGSTILSFRASGSGQGQTASTNFDLSKISALGNSILGGDGIYPNGPDLLTVVGNIVDSSGVNLSNPYSISARITWQESQA